MSDARDLLLERHLTSQAADAAGRRRAGNQLTEFAEQRAGTGPVRDLVVRDFRRELLEEIADGRNYAVWDWLQATELGADDAGIQALRTLMHLTSAYHEALEIPVRGPGCQNSSA